MALLPVLGLQLCESLVSLSVSLFLFVQLLEALSLFLCLSLCLFLSVSLSHFLSLFSALPLLSLPPIPFHSALCVVFF